MLASSSDFVVGRDRLGRWTAVGAHGLAGGIFNSREAALRYARSETGRRPGAVRQTSAPLRLALTEGRVGRQGEGLPAWWRLGPATQGTRTFAATAPLAAGKDKLWAMIDIGIVAGFAALCVAVGMIVT